jgi:hypothetical protein
MGSILRRGAAASGLVALLLAGSASSAAGSVTIGQLAPANPPSGCTGGNVDFAQPTVVSGNSYVVPNLAGAITSWSHSAFNGPGQQYTFKVWRKVGEPAKYEQVGHDGPRDLAPGVINTFPTNIPVKPGDFIGFHGAATSHACAFFVGVTGEYRTRTGNMNDGEQFDFAPFSNMFRLNISAAFEPTNTFTVAGTTRNKKKGTATITLTLPNPGELAGSGKGVKVASAAGAHSSKAVPGPGEATLLIKAKGKKKRRLNQTGKVKVSPTITFTPTSGSAHSEPIRVKLKKL